MSKSYVRSKAQSFKQNSNNNNNKKVRNSKSYNKKLIQRKNYNNNTKSTSTKIQKKKEVCEVQMLKKEVHFNEIVEVGYTHPSEEYDRTSIVASKLTSEDILEILSLREQYRKETIEATKQRAMEEAKQTSPVMSSPTISNLAVYASTSVGSSSLLTEVPTVTPSIISSPVLTPRTKEDDLAQKQREIEYMIYQKQQLENNYLEALHYQQTLQYLAQQQQNFDLWRLYNQQSFIESDIYLQQTNTSYYPSTFVNNNVSPSMALWFAPDNAPFPSDYEVYPLMTQMEVM